MPLDSLLTSENFDSEKAPEINDLPVVVLEKKDDCLTAERIIEVLPDLHDPEKYFSSLQKCFERVRNEILKEFEKHFKDVEQVASVNHLIESIQKKIEIFLKQEKSEIGIPQIAPDLLTDDYHPGKPNYATPVITILSHQEERRFTGRNLENEEIKNKELKDKMEAEERAEKIRRVLGPVLPAYKKTHSFSSRLIPYFIKKV